MPNDATSAVATAISGLLDTQAATVKKPAPLPVGTYMLLIKAFEFGASTNKKTPYVRFLHQIMGTGPDVDQSKLTSPGPDYDPIDLAKRSINDDFYLTPDALYRLTEHMKLVGIDLGARTIKECLPLMIGRQLYGYITQQPSQKPGSTDTFPTITSYSPAS